mmetsp:Transcript_29420/g.72826  ORF Transcript_29420/g.72826 Transcript_29420/m.72826 type:complete len:241 (+) Transcript_29420:562-1284(+)
MRSMDLGDSPRCLRSARVRLKFWRPWSAAAPCCSSSSGGSSGSVSCFFVVSASLSQDSISSGSASARFLRTSCCSRSRASISRLSCTSAECVAADTVRFLRVRPGRGRTPPLPGLPFARGLAMPGNPPAPAPNPPAGAPPPICGVPPLPPLEFSIIVPPGTALLPLLPLPPASRAMRGSREPASLSPPRPTPGLVERDASTVVEAIVSSCGCRKRQSAAAAALPSPPTAIKIKRMGGRVK